MVSDVKANVDYYSEVKDIDEIDGCSEVEDMDEIKYHHMNMISPTHII